VHCRDKCLIVLAWIDACSGRPIGVIPTVAPVAGLEMRSEVVPSVARSKLTWAERPYMSEEAAEEKEKSEKSERNQRNESGGDEVEQLERQELQEQHHQHELPDAIYDSGRPDAMALDVTVTQYRYNPRLCVCCMSLEAACMPNEEFLASEQHGPQGVVSRVTDHVPNLSCLACMPLSACSLWG
jgi:hypothetical protein